MHRPFIFPGLLFILLGTQVAHAQSSKQQRFAARFADGSRAEGNALTDWHVTQGSPKLDGKSLLDANNPMLWLRDRLLLPGAQPKAFVEMTCGDCLPGVVVGYHAGGESSFDTAPAHFIVKPDTPLRPPQAPEQSTVRVAAASVRRIAWQRLVREEYRPGTVFFRDGRSAPYRSARFSETGVNLLLAEGPRKAGFNELAEIHLPAADPWDVYFDELVSVGTTSKTRLLQLETTDGLVVTSSLDRFAAHVVGNPTDPGRWVHGLHPAWSLDILWTPCNLIWMRRLFVPHEPPLSRLRPLSGSPATAAGEFRLNRNELGSPLRGGQHDFGWGFGVHAPSELAFPLPRCVLGLRAFVGLDRAVGKGGCVWARVFADSTATPPLYESGFLVGSELTSDTGMIALSGPVGGQKNIVLQVDAAHVGRPEGADPLGIRDSADWFDPVLLLDAAKLYEELESRRARLSPAWKDWTVQVPAENPPAQAGVLEAANYPDDLAASPGAFCLGVYARLRPVSLSREINIGPRDNWLVLAVHQQVNQGHKTKLEVRIDGEPIAEYTVPPRSRDSRNPTPLAVPLANFQRHKVRVEILQHPASAPAPVLWQTIRVVEQLPSLRALFNDEGAFTALDEAAGGEATLYEDDKHSGVRSLKVTPAGRFQLKLASPIAVREKPGWGEYRYLRFAFRKFGKGRISLELDQPTADAKPVRYDAGNGSPAFGAAKRVWTLDLPAEWIVMTRDLYADFGRLDASGLTLSAVDGDYALFDQVYLARTEKDFEAIPSTVSAEATNQKARRELAKPTLDKILPASVALDFGDGRFGSGTLFTTDGYVLTAGHLTIAPNRDVTVFLADGREAKGKTRGVYREADIGVVKLVENGPWPFVEINPAKDVPSEQLFIGVAYPRTYRPRIAPAAHVVAVRRTFRGQVWTDFDLDDYSAGGPLVDKDGRLVAVQNRRSQFGGFMCSRVDEIMPLVERLKNGEQMGSWLAGSGPTYGASIAPTRDGARVTDVVRDGPAAKGGLQTGDTIKRVKSKPVVSIEDIHSALADSEPGQEVIFEYVRDKQTAETRVVLAPRVP